MKRKAELEQASQRKPYTKDPTNPRWSKVGLTPLQKQISQSLQARPDPHMVTQPSFQITNAVTNCCCCGLKLGNPPNFCNNCGKPMTPIVEFVNQNDTEWVAKQMRVK
jgi:hypothetical protein